MTIRPLIATALLALMSFAAHACDDFYVLRGHTIIKDDRVWSCQALTEAEKKETERLDLESLAGENPEKSCLVRDLKGRPSLLRVRDVLPGSTLVTYHPQSETYMRQTWTMKPLGLKMFTDSKTGSSIQLPQILVSHGVEQWKGSPDGPMTD